jgi:hypothetical protein
LDVIHLLNWTFAPFATTVVSLALEGGKIPRRFTMDEVNHGDEKFTEDSQGLYGN